MDSWPEPVENIYGASSVKNGLRKVRWTVKQREMKPRLFVNNSVFSRKTSQLVS